MDDSSQPLELPWARLPKESAKAYAAFKLYLDRGPDRSHDRVGAEMAAAKGIAGKQGGSGRGATGRIRLWSGVHRWVERCRAWDDHISAIEAAAKARKAAEKAELWAER